MGSCDIDLSVAICFILSPKFPQLVLNVAGKIPKTVEVKMQNYEIEQNRTELLFNIINPLGMVKALSCGVDNYVV